MATVSQGADMRELGDEELVSRLRESKEELFNLKFQLATGQLDNNRRVQTVRRDIARIYTVMRERELGITYASVASSDSATSTASATSPASTAGPAGTADSGDSE